MCKARQHKGESFAVTQNQTNQTIIADLKNELLFMLSLSLSLLRDVHSVYRCCRSVFWKCQKKREPTIVNTKAKSQTTRNHSCQAITDLTKINVFVFLVVLPNLLHIVHSTKICSPYSLLYVYENRVFARRDKVTVTVVGSIVAVWRE